MDAIKWDIMQQNHDPAKCTTDLQLKTHHTVNEIIFTIKLTSWRPGATTRRPLDITGDFP